MSESAPLPHPPLSLVEARILGCLLEKERTTPDYYPMTLNALVNACNQKSNRHPILELNETAVSAGLDSLRSKHLIFRVSQADARVAKFKHSLDKVYPIPDEQQVILTELLIRGPQTAGELRTRCERMIPFESLDAVREELKQMSEGEHPLVVELPRQPGKKDPRFAHLLSDAPDLGEMAPASTSPLRVDVAIALPEEAEARIAALESSVAAQQEAIEALKAELSAFLSQFE